MESNHKQIRLRDDLTGQRFGRVLVLGRAGVDSVRQVTYDCICDCGVRFVARGGNLKRGNTTSCGCYRAQLAHNRALLLNAR